MNIPDTLIAKLLLALLLGGAIGIERELRSKSAGFRTIILICLGATLFTILSKYIGAASPDRIASNVVVGIGFIGAGVIFRSEKGISGITTAASIWLTAAVGMGIGCGYYEASILGCILVLLVLFLFSFFDKFLDKLNQLREYKITYTYQNKHQHKYDNKINEFNLKIINRSLNKNGVIITCSWVVTGKESNHHLFIDYLLNDNSISDFDF